VDWSDSAMAKRYQHVTGTIRADVAEQVGGLLWTPCETRSETTGCRPDDSRPG
jgi:integrase